MRFASLFALAFALAGCTMPAHEPRDAAAPTCGWIVTVNPPPIDARGNGCTIRALEAPARVSLLIDLGSGHSLAIDSDDPIPGDPYGRDEPPLLFDGVYMPCGPGVAGRITVNIGGGTWSVKADFSACQQSVLAKVGGYLPLARD